ncbi:class I SAM-dependent methyltransferase [Blastococcus sp. CT_GayMR16]|uniref:class I SAM-dependent methyltransferase n=1 Tax=Blastococcus sp. CT_GayMR16 TaxID=2559607 RepID=UPI00142FDCF4|nr:class I SAM-dependent methyltransferase [Blastococcus sp. CT_GayMR16]
MQEPRPEENGAVTDAPRDLVDYVEQYRALPFEPLQIAFRRRRVLARVAAHGPRRLLEIGCGESPIFLDLPGLETVVVEPAPAFAANARRLADGRPEVTVLERYAEDLDASDGPFDMVVVSCLLHEVPDPQRLLAAARRLCAAGGVLHVNVPSARSLHRLLAVAMGLIPDVTTESDTQRTMQQRGVYDAAGLEGELHRAGFAVTHRGSIFVKPFTHAQMQHLVDEQFLTSQMLDGLDALALLLPDLGSELWMDAEPVDA